MIHNNTPPILTHTHTLTFNEVHKAINNPIWDVQQRQQMGTTTANSYFIVRQMAERIRENNVNQLL